MLRIKNSSVQSARVALILSALFAVVAVICIYAVTAKAVDQQLWPQADASAEIEAVDSGLPALENWHIKGCKVEEGIVRGVATTGPLCVVHGKDVSLASFRAPNYGRAGIAVRIGSDSKYYVMSLGIDQMPILVPGTNVFMYNSEYYNYSYYRPTMYRNLADGLIAVNDGITPRTYRLKDSSYADYVLKAQDGSSLGSSKPAYSRNGRYFAFSGSDGIIYVDTKTDYYRYIGPEGSQFYSSSEFELAVSDDGQYVAVGGYGMPHQRVYHTAGCGDIIRDNSSSYYGHTMQNPCQYYDFGVQVERLYGEAHYNKYSFSSDSGQLSFQLGGPYDQYPANQKVVTITSPGCTPPPRLEYLAMGDSYSSGEGDTAKNPDTNRKYYRNYTDNEENAAQNIPREKCHISTRSYPYLLAQTMGLSLNGLRKWNTIACSGATAWAVKDQGSPEYEGQDGRLIGYDQDALKSQALNEFIPGRQKQIEFVKKYKPKVITLTMGGNDIGFGDKIISCVMPGTCRTVGESGLEVLANQIDRQFSNLKSLYNDLYIASDSTAKIYVVGYPKFINGDKAASCPVNIGALNDTEREMIQNGIVYLNRVIKKAAQAAGVKYIDIEDSLDGHKLCDEGDSFVTGIAAWMTSEKTESFHPNARGHIQIATHVWDKENVNGESLLDYEICPLSKVNACPDLSVTKDNIVVPEYFQTLESQPETQYQKMMADDAVKGAPSRVSTNPYTLAPGSLAQLTLHSDPVDLGSYTVSDNGQVDVSVLIPADIPAGYHTLTLTGLTYSGEPIQFEQVVLVQGADLDDIDDDGTIDSQEACVFIDSSGVDSDDDGIDDACDPEIGKVLKSYTNTIDNSPRLGYAEIDSVATNYEADSSDGDGESSYLEQNHLPYSDTLDITTQTKLIGKLEKPSYLVSAALIAGTIVITIFSIRKLVKLSGAK